MRWCCRGTKCRSRWRASAATLDSVAIPIFDNDQDIPRLAARVAAYAEATPLQYGFLVRGHGLYCWGSQVAEARRHLEGLEFLFQCELQRRLLEAK